MKGKPIFLTLFSILWLIVSADTTMAGPDKQQMAALRKCIEAQGNLAMMAKQTADVLVEARKGGKADEKKYQALMKAVNKWMARVPKECEGMGDLLAELKQSGVDSKAIMKCYDSYERAEDKCVKTASKKLQSKKVKNSQSAQKKIVARLNQCVEKAQNPLKSCIGKNATGNKKAVATLNEKFSKINDIYYKCWEDCSYKERKESDMADICDSRCQKDSDRRELSALKDFIKEISN